MAGELHGRHWKNTSLISNIEPEPHSDGFSKSMFRDPSRQKSQAVYSLLCTGFASVRKTGLDPHELTFADHVS